MLKKLKSAFITLGIASGMTAAALAFLHNPTSCRALVLRDLDANAKFASDVGKYVQQPDFLTTLKGSK